jgi:hypothetical protein
VPLSKGAAVYGKLKGMQVNVTQDIIDTAVPANSGHCMISDAVMAAARQKKWKIGKVLTDLQTIRFTDLKKAVRYICFTPRVGQLALLAFDQGVKPEPFGFHLRPVQILPRQSRGKRLPRPRVAISVKKDGIIRDRPMKHGGSALPITVGLRREFGLRSLGVWKPPTEAETVTAS